MLVCAFASWCKTNLVGRAGENNTLHIGKHKTARFGVPLTTVRRRHHFPRRQRAWLRALRCTASILHPCSPSVGKKKPVVPARVCIFKGQVVAFAMDYMSYMTQLQQTKALAYPLPPSQPPHSHLPALASAATI